MTIFSMSRRLTSGWIVSALLLLAGCASGPVSPVERMSSWRPLYGIAAPSAEELAGFEQVAIGKSEEGRPQLHNGVAFRRVSVAGRDCVLFVTGVSVVNAAMTTQLALDRFALTHVILLGAAGGVNPVRQSGEVVIPDRWTYHTEAAYRNPTPNGSAWELPPGVTPVVPNFGMIFPEIVEVTRAGPAGPQPVPSFESDPGLRAAALKVSTDRSNSILDGTWPKMVTSGMGVSGPAFVDNREYRSWLYRAWQAEIVDLESAAVAQVCWANRVPFISVRAVAGLAGGNLDDSAPTRSSPPVIHQAARVVLEMLRQLPD
ncbi:MAG TPA: 5'-methylthioadenosine/S-adenosylhomocysteine nucleosidase [Verrucomicrobiota bacterium]|nr:5'-methylthioadenosine/S-adenosylhomocysteine nucleosidase [Verrucomicrobiota bacterium]